MAAKKRESDTHLKDRLFSEFYRFSFFQAVSLIEALYPDRDALGRSLVPTHEAVRFRVEPGFSFPPSDLSSLEVPDDGRPIEMGVSFMGLIGPSGVLPRWYNALAAERNRQKDFAASSFFDIFHHRLISLFYLAWKKGRLPENYTSGEDDRLSSYLLSLSGLGTKGLARMIGLPKEALAFYTGLLSKQAPSAAAIEATVAYLSGTDVRVEQFVERDIDLDEEDRTSLGMRNASLGVDTICGTCIKDCQSTFRIELGPMGYDEFRRFLPGSGDLIRPIFFLVKYMVGMEFEFDIRITLRKDEVPACELGKKEWQLGRSTWLKLPRHGLHEDVSIIVEEADAMGGFNASGKVGTAGTPVH
ncbi:MAG TPA: type VI secretion system baseplate subunit TssG [Deltaproteobacteria bacterium]|jgi:type VI secretion system protein ImpH|nr:type VI secretion system baseplate subunit TssG [Deltaproteobacteria bacterium]HQI00101.1 type VI secretion system baseplate subunit TssG [Deltaproteobacteria bacterium]